MSLHDFQRDFVHGITSGDVPAGVDPRGMRVYARNYHGQLIASLRDTYAKTHLWLGDDAFDAEAGRYVDRHAPSSWTLDAYGDRFADMLDARFPADPDIGELAWLDQALRRAFSGVGAEAIGMSGLVADDWDRIGFGFVPTLCARRLRTNAVVIWKALADGTMPPAATALSHDGGVRVWRDGLAPRFSSMDADEYACLDLALAGGTFGEICALLVRRHGVEGVATEAGRLLRTWVGDGLLASLRPG
jgi:hypothetical protein